VNNVYVSTCNVGGDADEWLAQLPAEAIGEIHLAGHALDPGSPQGGLLIDTHGAPVCEVVWELYGRLVQRIGPRPTLIERDEDIPAFEVLMQERDRAAVMLSATHRLGEAYAIAC